MPRGTGNYNRVVSRVAQRFRRVLTGQAGAADYCNAHCTPSQDNLS
jgi:hypothetical protein